MSIAQIEFINNKLSQSIHFRFEYILKWFESSVELKREHATFTIVVEEEHLKFDKKKQRIEFKTKSFDTNQNQVNSHQPITISNLFATLFSSKIFILQSFI